MQHNAVLAKEFQFLTFLLYIYAFPKNCSNRPAVRSGKYIQYIFGINCRPIGVATRVLHQSFLEGVEEGGEEASLDNAVSAEDRATKFREGYEMSLNLL